MNLFSKPTAWTYTRYPLVVAAVAAHSLVLGVAAMRGFPMMRGFPIIGVIIWSIASIFIAFTIARSHIDGKIYIYQGYGILKSEEPGRFWSHWIATFVFWLVWNGLFTYGFLWELRILVR